MSALARKLFEVDHLPVNTVVPYKNGFRYLRMSNFGEPFLGRQPQVSHPTPQQIFEDGEDINLIDVPGYMTVMKVPIGASVKTRNGVRYLAMRGERSYLTQNPPLRHENRWEASRLVSDSPGSQDNITELAIRIMPFIPKGTTKVYVYAWCIGNFLEPYVNGNARQNSTNQMASVIEMVNALKEKYAVGCSVYDPVTTPKMKAFLDGFGFRYYSSEQGWIAVSKSDPNVANIYFLPFCDVVLIDEVLKANWSKDRLGRIIVIMSKNNTMTDRNKAYAETHGWHHYARSFSIVRKEVNCLIGDHDFVIRQYDSSKVFPEPAERIRREKFHFYHNPLKTETEPIPFILQLLDQKRINAAKKTQNLKNRHSRS